ncbi:MAG: tRNA-dihydrouridine synthase [Butyricicoccus sp.]
MTAKGAGFLAHPDELDRFFDEVFAKCEGISVKTRLGVHEASEFDKLLEIYNRYPITELTIHPRVRQDFYKGKVRESDFAAALPRCSMPVCYNGDLITERDVSAVSERYPDLPAVMIGRALIADPSLVMRLTGGKAADAKMLETFHDTLFVRYCEAFGDSRIAMLRMKEIWFYHLNLFENSEKTGKAIKKAKNAAEFQTAAAAVFRDCRVRANAVPLWFKPA